MKYLTEYVDKLNVWRNMTGTSLFNLKNLDEAMATKLLYNIEGDLSPENLHMDGEASKKHVRERSKLLNGALNELADLGYTLK